MKDSLFVTCARGLEDILAQELKQILHSHPIVDKGGVHVHGKLKELYQINLHTRIGMHVLKPILELKSNNVNQLYDIVKSFNWSKIITKNDTFSIRTRVNSSFFKNSNEPDSKDRFENVAELLTSIEEFSNRDPEATLNRFLEDVSLQTDIDHWNDSENRVAMMTVHSSKGLEFPVVFIAGLDEGLFPIFGSLDDKKRLES